MKIYSNKNERPIPNQPIIPIANINIVVWIIPIVHINNVLEAYHFFADMFLDRMCLSKPVVIANAPTHKPIHINICPTPIP
jgi:hypothetical protein